MTPADLQRIRSSPGWRTHRVEVFHDTSLGSVLVKGQRAPRPPWRYQLLNAVAALARLPLLRAAPAHGSARAQQIEVARLRQLAAAGVAVPQVLHVEADFFVQSYLGDAAARCVAAAARRGAAGGSVGCERWSSCMRGANT